MKAYTMSQNNMTMSMFEKKTDLHLLLASRHDTDEVIKGPSSLFELARKQNDKSRKDGNSSRILLHSRVPLPLAT